MNGDGMLTHQAATFSGLYGARNVDHAKSIVEIRTTLEQLRERDKSVTERLNELIRSQESLSRELGKLDLMRANVGSQGVAVRSISNNLLSDAASTAKRISGAVQRLDLEQSRVKSTLEVIEQVAELKACVLGVTGSMGAPQDWETAAAYLNRAFKIPTEIIHGAFAEEIVPSAEVPDPPGITLDSAAESLCGLFLREFEKAAQENNGAKVSRFFKLFPLIGRPEVGLDVYGRYVCLGVASRARSNLNAGTGGSQRKDSFFYATALTKLFEQIAQIVEQHGSLVERHYGQGRMIRVIERLQMEADVQGGIIIDTWSEERSIDRKLTEIKSYAFTFLVQSFLATKPLKPGIVRTGSPALFGRDSAEIQEQEEEGADMKDVDGFLNEISVMLGRWSLYSRFLAPKCPTDPHAIGAVRSTPIPMSPHPHPTAPGKVLQMPLLLSNSRLANKIAERLIGPFNHMTTFYFRRSVEKAFQLDEQPLDLSLNLLKPVSTNTPYITSAVDDVMYIVNQVVQKALQTSQREVIASVIPTIARVLGSDFMGMMRTKMRDESYPKPLVQGALPPENIIVAFLVLMNNLDISAQYVKRIVESRQEPLVNDASLNGNQVKKTQISDMFPFDHDAVFVNNALTSLQVGFESKSLELLSDGVFAIFKNVMKPRLRPVLADTFRDVDYAMTEVELDELKKEAELEGVVDVTADDVVPNRFQHGWEALTKPIARILTRSNFDKLLSMIVSYLGEVLEKRIWSYYGRVNVLGAVRLERDIAGLVGLIVRDGRYALRDSFTRCTQICTVMNMEEDEWEELQREQKAGEFDESEWRINFEERSRAKALVRSR
ncbi:hypothetical protein MMC25_003316 [Agyrium rufum]|nr:hypothetical protein [Agyrium rufum]